VELQHTYPRFVEAGVEVFALAVATLESVEGWCQSRGYEFPLLADPDHAVAEAYGVYDLLGYGFAAPAAFVVDTDGHVVWSKVSRGADWPSATEILEHLP
jgi:peroxiredoxin Q/BCP